ncbi:MAG: YHS domain-containing protein [Dehalococcoidales bacterium]|nr:YHS domain-containing protein [Dehalococcoidales bacterium]
MKQEASDITKTEMAIDPVSKMQVEVTKTAPFSEYKGKKYYFHSMDDKNTFDKDPEKFISK